MSVGSMPLIDGFWGAISAVLFMISGLGPVSIGVINVGLTLINGIITTSIDRGGIPILTTGDWIGIVSTATLAGIISGAARNSFFKGVKVCGQTPIKLLLAT